MKEDFIILEPGVTNDYLLQAESGYLLIDTGYEKDYEDFLKELRKNNVDLDEINYLLLTHHHDDHAGFVTKLREVCEFKIIAHEAAEELLKTGENDKTRDGGLINRRVYYLSKLGQKLIPGLFDLTFPPVVLKDKDILVEGDNQKLLKNIGIDGEILYTPGHTIDSISVLLKDGTIFCGDAAMSKLLWLGIKFCALFVTDFDQYYDSWEKIMGAGAKKLYPSHGKPFTIDKLEENIGEFDNECLIPTYSE